MQREAYYPCFGQYQELCICWKKRGSTTSQDVYEATPALLRILTHSLFPSLFSNVTLRPAVTLSPTPPSPSAAHQRHQLVVDFLAQVDK